jgi:hypothetical protein
VKSNQQASAGDRVSDNIIMLGSINPFLIIVSLPTLEDCIGERMKLKWLWIQCRIYCHIEKLREKHIQGKDMDPPESQEKKSWCFLVLREIFDNDILDAQTPTDGVKPNLAWSI